MPEYKSLDAWGAPVYGNDQAMQGPAQISEAAAMAMARGLRRFDTQSQLLGATGMAEDYYATVKAIPGAVFRFDGAAWIMYGTARFASKAARDAAITTPASGMRAYVGDVGYETIRIGSSWVGAGRPMIKPETLSGNGAVINADNSVSITAGNKIFFTRVFNSDFDSYEIEINPLYGSVNGQGINMRFSLDGTEHTDALYYFQGYSQSGDGGPSLFRARPAALFDLARCGNGAGSATVAKVEVFDPLGLVKTRAMWRSAGSDGSTDHKIDAGGHFGATRSHNGFVLFDAGSANFTGKVKVFGVGA